MHINSKIMDVMKDLVHMRDSVVPQNFTSYLAKTSTENNKANNRSTESANASHRSHNLSERSVLNSTSARDNIPRTRLPRKSSHRLTEDLSRQLNSARNATTHASELPLTLENPNDLASPPSLPQKTDHVRQTDRKQIATRLESQCSNVRLTADERKALISRILTNELVIQSKLAAQAKELFSSPKTETFQRKATPSKVDNDHLMASLMEKRLQIESKRAAQERLIFSPSVRSVFEQELPETVSPPTRNITSYGTKLAEKSGNDGISRSRPRVPAGSQTKQMHQKFGSSLTPIPEISESLDLDSAPGIDDGARNAKGKSRYNLETILAKENVRQQQMESGLPGELIQDIETSLLLQHSDESDSLDDLVIKDFAIRIVESEADPATSSLPITEQVMLESNKLKEIIESVKERFQIKVARDKFAERDKAKIQPPNTRTKVPDQGIIEHNKKKSEVLSSLSAYDKPSSSRTKRINILDSPNWGNVALPKPMFNASIEPSNSSIDETVLSERDMQFDDLFGAENVSEPASLRSVPQHEPPLNTKLVGQRQTEAWLDSITNIEDLESPQFGDLPSDISVRSIPENLNESFRDFKDLQTPPYRRMRETPNDSASKHSTTNTGRPNQHLSNGIDSAITAEHESDINKLKELIDSGALTSSIINQRFEEGVLDLLLRQSDSLWDPIVAGIPIIYFIPSRNHERGLLDTSIKDANLGSPLIKRPVDKLPEFMESLENEWTTNISKIDGRVADANNNDLVDDRNDESVLLHGLPKFSYEPVPKHFYRKKINLMDSRDETNADHDDDDDILNEQEMNFDDLVDNVAQPTYDFQKAKIMDDLEIKMRIIRRMTENRDVASKDLRLRQEFEMRKDKSPSKDPAQQTTQNRAESVENPVRARKSVSFVNNAQDNQPSVNGTNVSGSGKADATSQKTPAKSGDIGRWTTLDISEVKDLIEHARLAKHRGMNNSRIDKK